ncbi:hypothetical protein OHA18_08335 [Kribbella sp. NBC_00709]|uniref:hypothetical protein n=1 Tax=Kribbella sp. NBC_00709 TaxID=2975972 RepID=UPI002E2C89D4|nr:hypothetical protein [Kribbella sp. NBC_00709]
MLACGLVAGPLFVVVFLLEGAFKGSGYDVLRHPGELGESGCSARVRSQPTR